MSEALKPRILRNVSKGAWSSAHLIERIESFGVEEKACNKRRL